MNSCRIQKQEKMSGKENFKFKILDFKDLERVMEIERLSNPTPWSIGSFIDCINSNYQNILLIKQEEIIGFCISTINFTESHLLNISVHPQFRSQGMGQLLLNKSEQDAKKKGVSDIFLEVRDSNDRAIQFYKKNHYKNVGKRKNYYRLSQGREDGLIFTKHMNLSSLESISRFSLFFLRKMLNFNRG